MVILGLWDGHDAGAALIEEGRLTVAINEERLTRRKLEIGFPAGSIRECLHIRGMVPGDIDHVAISTHDWAKTLGRWLPSSMETHYRVRRRLAPPGWRSSLTKRLKYRLTTWPGNAFTLALSRHAVTRRLQTMGIHAAPLAFVDHHTAHASAAFLSGFAHAVVITLDGVGDGLSGSIHHYDGERLHPLARIPACHSLGIFFEHVTNLLNMRELEDEGKVMALADHALPVPDACNPLLALFQVSGLTITCRLHGQALYRQLARTLWTTPSEQFAFMAQRTLEHHVLHLVQNAIARTGAHHVVLAGGLFANIKINGLIRTLPGVEACHVFPHMGDGGLAVGAALHQHRLVAPSVPCQPLDHLQLGSSYDEATILAAIQAVPDLRQRRVDDPAAEAARLLAEGTILGWFQGAMEYGPRALGGRSILAPADRPSLRRELNVTLKKRTWYQPFCPSLLETEAERLLVDGQGPPDRFMTSAYHFREAYRERLASVSGQDGSCRPQMVAPGQDPFARLLLALHKRTGLGILLNTSFNAHGEPLVRTPADAIRTFQTTSLPCLIMGHHVITRCHTPA
ncbi:MAG: hypothetical protein H7833_11520 [Magnetococcus sp. DMHC-1]|nr:hypothetical protein [Magnetococcales bacterium]